MKPLAPNLFERRFDDFVEAGRARIPTLAPAWTDYNLHDPGITLLDLLAWESETQLYALSRMRRDERRAYAAMLGVQGAGGVPARGSLWPDGNDPESPFATYRQSLVIGADARVSVSKGDLPVFRPTHPILWVPAQLLALTTQTPEGVTLDRLPANGTQAHGFEPFGPDARPASMLRLAFETHGPTGLFPRERDVSALLSLGVRTAQAFSAANDAGPTALQVTCISEGRRVAVPVVRDTTSGLSRSGVLLLDVADVRGSPTQFALEIRPVARMPLAPRILEIQLGVLPVEQSDVVEGEPHAANGQVDQRVQLDVPGLRFGDGVAPLQVRVAGAREDSIWTAVDDLRMAGPEDRVYQLDTATEEIVFGNGINGQLPPSDATILLTYPITAGEAGNAGRRKTWTVQGVTGVFGTNVDPMTGGRDALDDIDRRRESRQRASTAHALVTAEDIASAALALDDLAVARARMVASPTPGESRLIVMQRRGDEPFDASRETTTWREAIRARLASRLPLGTRLRVQAPQFMRFSVQAQLRTGPRQSPDDVQREALKLLTQRYVPRTGSGDAFPLGVDVSARDIAAQLRRVPGVARVESLTLRDADAVEQARVRVPPRGLAWLDVGATSLPVSRGTSGADA